MRRLVTVLAVVASVLVLVLVAGATMVVWSVRRPYPDYAGEAALPGLAGDVQVLRDAHGIPHVYADTPEDLFRAQGYVHAQDRFWQMDYRRHVASGRLAELFGEGQVPADTFLRTLGWRRVAEAELPLLEPATRRYLDAYAGGVNAWADGRSGGELGLAYTLLGLRGGSTSPDRWAAVDSLSWLKAMAWDLRANMRDEIDRALLSGLLPPERVEQLYPAYPYDRNPTILPEPGPAASRAAGRAAPDGVRVTPDRTPLPAAATDALRTLARATDALPEPLATGRGVGSNSWVVGGDRSATGKPLLVNDTHLAPSLASPWYQVGLHCRSVDERCPFDLVGFSFAGLPGVVVGHNADIAWGVSNLGADVTDLVLERVEGDSYLVGREMVPLERRTERITVAGGDPVTVTIRTSRNGPLVSDAAPSLAAVGKQTDAGPDAPAGGEGYAVALRWTALQPGRTADAVFAMNAARDWPSFRAAAALMEVPAQNLVYADVEGNIGYQAPGRIPVRRSADGRYPAPGWTGEGDWVGYLPFAALPRALNPGAGFVVAANQAVTGPGHPFEPTRDWDYGARARRLHDLLVQAGPLDRDAALRIATDTRSPLVDWLLPVLQDIPNLGEDYYTDGQELLEGWDGRQHADSAAAAYFNAVWANLLRLTFHDELPEELWPDGGERWAEVVRAMMADFDDPFWDDAATDNVPETRDTIVRQAMREARDDLTRRLGKDAGTWTWGRLHQLWLREPTFGSSGSGPVEALFDRGPYAVGGGVGAVQATGWTASRGYEVATVPSMRMVVDLADLDASGWVDLAGVSGHPHHDGYVDQVQPWRDGRLLPMRWSLESVRRDAKHTMTLAGSEPAPG